MKKIIIFCILAILVIMASGCKKEAEEPKTEPVAPPVVEPEPEPELPEPEVETEYAGVESDMLSRVVCKDEKIAGIVTNIGDSTAVIGKDLKILLRGMVIKDPQCDKMELEPEESTTCASMQGPFKLLPGQNEVVATHGAEIAKATVFC